ncbi:hypothetical protein ABZ896_02835 [Streptomyces sp. NPDC047072]|uniref:hypothetical protein n=1 Tax=Streptomyces sp. NPDC047072 TaxID=3154809 RepID=UPI0033D70E98
MRATRPSVPAPLRSVALPPAAIQVLGADAVQSAVLSAVIWLPSLFLAVIGLCSVLSNVSESGLFATTLPSELYVAGQAASYPGQTVAILAGPAIGGLLVQLAGVPAAVGVDAATAVTAARFLLRLRPVERLHQACSPGSRDRRPGPAFIRRSPLIRTALAVTATGNFIGFVFTVQAIGGLAGAALASRLARRIGLGRMLLVGCVLSHAPLLVIPAVGESVQDISVGSVFALVVPAHLRSQTRGAYQTVSFGLRPLGSVAGALIAATAGIPAVLWAGAIGGTLSCLWLLAEQPESATAVPR